jgi:putative ABC transport system substrate-binding protein
VSALASRSPAPAQPSTRAARIALLDRAPEDAASTARWAAFRGELTRLGHVDGGDVVLFARPGDGTTDRLKALAAGLGADRVDLVVTASSEAALAVKERSSALPIVTATGGDPIALGLARSLAHPGGNVTGMISLLVPLVAKRLELVKQALPRASRIAILRDPTNRASRMSWQEAQNAAALLGVTVQDVPVPDPARLGAAFAQVQQARMDAAILAENTRFLPERRRIAELAISHRVPVLLSAREYVEAGGLMSYGTDYLDLFRRAASFVDRILKGAKPADLPMEQATKFETVVNLRTARALGLAIPSSVLSRADVVIR